MPVHLPWSRWLFWALTVGAIGGSLHIVLGEVEISVGWAAATGVAYVSYVVVGVLIPTLQMHADSISHCDTTSIALTFDDGPHPGTTPQVLALLSARGHKATFFVIGEKACRYPQLLRDIVSAGHEIGLHSYAHPWTYAFKSPDAVVADIRRTQQAVWEACGRRPILFRPPVGLASPRTAVGVKRAAVRMVLWSVRAYDGVPHANVSKMMRRLRQRIRPGAIVLLHDASSLDRFVPPSLAVLPRILDDLDARGLRSRCLSDVLPAADVHEESSAPKPVSSAHAFP